jgi:hypothetical protein
MVRPAYLLMSSWFFSRLTRSACCPRNTSGTVTIASETSEGLFPLGAWRQLHLKEPCRKIVADDPSRGRQDGSRVLGQRFRC